MRIRLGYTALALLFLVLGVYYPSIFAGVNSVDDQRMLLQLESMQNIDFFSLFVPHNSFYYRPLLMLSFWFDKVMWNLEPSFMHLENILLHACNSLLVFFLIKRFFPASVAIYAPLLGSALFALHPINTESVNWISGRTDLLASFWLLLSLHLQLYAWNRHHRGLVFLASIFFLLAVASKEISAFYLLVALYFFWGWPSRSENTHPRIWRIQAAFVFASPVIIGGLSYLIKRLLSFGLSGDKGLLYILDKFNYGPFDIIRVSLKVFGFYVKKLLVPVPLNFAIVEINDGYVILGALMLLLVTLWVRSKNLPTQFTVVSLVLISPAVLIALTSVAWTPVAERYLYFPSFFLSMGVAGWLTEKNAKKSRAGVWLLGAIALLLLPATVVTVQRNIIWQSNLSLYEDTLAKSPTFTSLKNELGIALIANGKLREAEKILDSGIATHGTWISGLLYVNKARVLVERGEFVTARNLLLDVVGKKISGREDVLRMLARIDEKRLLEAKDPEEVEFVREQLIQSYERLFSATKDPISLYRTGQLLISAGDKKEAARFFSEAYERAPQDAYYRQAAKKLAEKMRRE
ncbi:MAG: hypothetical protein C0621_11095 [Desulfuromonas sp.]|nr:MAG: hypothetical protein C0621_11095 [Desulfuromonas sp.]